MPMLTHGCAACFCAGALPQARAVPALTNGHAACFCTSAQGRGRTGMRARACACLFAAPGAKKKIPLLYKGKSASQRPKRALAAFSSPVGGSPPSSCGLAIIPFRLAGWSWSFSRASMPSGVADEKAGLASGNEDNMATRYSGREKPPGPLYSNGSKPVRCVVK